MQITKSFEQPDSAAMLQLELSKRLPLCYATLLGTHNSGISLADGYGNLDLAYQHYFHWISWVVRVLPSLAFFCVMPGHFVSDTLVLPIFPAHVSLGNGSAVGSTV